jgi:hypothetical protein
MSEPAFERGSAPPSGNKLDELLDELLLAPAFVCTMLSISLPTLKRISELQPIQLRDDGRAVRYRKSDVLRYIASRGTSQSQSADGAA